MVEDPAAAIGPQEGSVISSKVEEIDVSTVTALAEREEEAGTLLAVEVEVEVEEEEEEAVEAVVGVAETGRKARAHRPRRKNQPRT